MKRTALTLFSGLAFVIAGCGNSNPSTTTGSESGSHSDHDHSTQTDHGTPNAPEQAPKSDPVTPPAPHSGAGTSSSDHAITIDSGLPRYQSAEAAVDGALRLAGSDTMANIAGLWLTTFNQFYPGVQPHVEAKGSSIGPPALMENQAQFAPMSRAMTDEEVDRFVSKFGYQPTQLRTGIDAIGIFVHKDNPIEDLSLADLAEAFSVSGGRTTWGDLGVEDERWRDRPVQLYGRNSASGTYKFFKDHALAGADFKNDVKENPGSSGVVNAVASDPYGMGYSGIGYLTPDVKVIKLSYEEGDEAFTPNLENANSGDYPLARFMYLYTNYDSRAGLEPLRAEFVKLIFSQQGQESIVQAGFFPVSADLAAEELEKVGMELGR